MLILMVRRRSLIQLVSLHSHINYLSFCLRVSIWHQEFGFNTISTQWGVFFKCPVLVRQGPPTHTHTSPSPLVEGLPRLQCGWRIVALAARSDGLFKFLLGHLCRRAPQLGSPSQETPKTSPELPPAVTLQSPHLQSEPAWHWHWLRSRGDKNNPTPCCSGPFDMGLHGNQLWQVGEGVRSCVLGESCDLVDI